MSGAFARHRIHAGTSPTAVLPLHYCSRTRTVKQLFQVRVIRKVGELVQPVLRLLAGQSCGFPGPRRRRRRCLVPLQPFEVFRAAMAGSAGGGGVADAVIVRNDRQVARADVFLMSASISRRLLDRGREGDVDALIVQFGGCARRPLAASKTTVTWFDSSP